MGLSVFAGVFAGKWVQDNWTHWEPWTLIIGFGFGCTAATRALMRTARDWRREIEEREKLADFEQRESEERFH